MEESEIARIRRLIELECEAMERGLTGYAIAARHDIIAHRYDRLDTYRDQLEHLIGENSATEMLVEIYLRMVG